MPTQPFGSRSRKLLAGCHPDLITFCEEVNKGMQCTILPSTLRTIENQKDYFYGTNNTGVNPGKKKLSKTLNSKHLPQANGLSHAVDMAPDPVNFERSGYQLDLIYFAGYAKRIAEELKASGKITNDIVFGGDWNKNGLISDESFQDTNHWQVK